MGVGTYLKWNAIVGSVLAAVILLGAFLFDNPYVALFLVLLISVVAYRQYRKLAYFE